MTAKDDEVIIMKVLLLGDIGVGKTTLLSRFAGEGYQEDYPHFETKSRLVSHGNKKIRVVLCDTDGQERFGTLTTALYKGIQGCVLMFSVTEPKSLEMCEQWIAETKRYSGDAKISYVLVGNKCDQDVVVDDETARAWAKLHGMPYFVTSARTDNVEKLFNAVFERIWKNMSKNSSGSTSSSTADSGSGSRCTLL